MLLLGYQSPADQTVDIPANTTTENRGLSAGKNHHKELDIITIFDKGYDNARKGPVNFYHERHARQYNINCWACHHDYADGEENTWLPWGTTEKCSECHDPVAKKNDVIKLQTAFHKNCITCHQETGLYKGMRPSQTCGKCHVQKLIIKYESYQEDKMGPVAFQHEKHVKTYLNLDGNNISCKECHHVYVNGKNIWNEGDTVKKCGAPGCHDPLENRGGKQVKLRTAYHIECKVCHRDITKSGSGTDIPHIWNLNISGSWTNRWGVRKYGPNTLTWLI